MNSTVIIATKDRYEDIVNLLKSIAQQSLLPNEVIIVDSSEHTEKHEEFIAYRGNTPLNLNYIRTDKRGLTVQRNIGINNISKQSDVVFFFDDDLLLEQGYIENIMEVYQSDKNNDIGGVGGYLLQDGTVHSPIPVKIEKQEACTLYGCNMSYKLSAIKNERFDENLSLYAWMEDWDFSYRVATNYKLYNYTGALARHLQSTSGRINEKKLGFMLIGNRHYLYKKNNFFSYKDYVYYFMQVSKNILLAYRKGRRQRLMGNMIALVHIVFLNKKIQYVNNI